MGRTYVINISLWFSLLSLFLLPSLIQAALPSSKHSSKMVEDKDCLECHKDKRLKYVNQDGEFISLFVDPEIWSNDIHHKNGVRCIDCHVNVNTQVHSKEGYAKVDCTRKCHLKDAKGFISHKQNLEEVKKSIHPIGVFLKDNKIIYCHDCHSKHALFPNNDPRSSLSSINAPLTCSKCHEPGKKVKGLVNNLLRFRINSHEKTDFSQRFEETMCLDCHYQESTHLKITQEKQYCNQCHIMTKGKKIFFSPIHLDTSFSNQPITFLMKIVYFLIILFCLAVISLYLIFYILKKIKDESFKKKILEKFIISDETAIKE